MSAELHRVRCAAFGVEFLLAAESEELLKTMGAHAPLGAAEIVDRRDEGAEADEFMLRLSGDVFCVRRNGELIADDVDLDAALAQFARELMVHVAEYAPERVFVHAGVVSWHGRGLVMPGASFAGKTTLVAELVRAGAVYYSDEYAVLDADGNVHPYSRALAMRCDSNEVQTPLGVEELGGVAGNGPVRASHVVFAEYAPGAEWRPEVMSPGTAALEMLRHSVPVQRTPGRVMATLARMMASAAALRSQRGEARETARALLAMLDAGEQP